MNNRMIELAQAAGMYVDLNSNPWPKWMTAEECELAYAKFAELIVADCLKQIKDGLVDESELLYEHEETTECVNEALMDAHHNIAIHFGFAAQFGVEE